MPDTSPLPHRLRLATRSLHQAAERAGVMPLLLRGQLPLHRYRLLLAQLGALYTSLESSLERHRDDARLAPLCQLGLHRLPALQQDLHTGQQQASTAWPVLSTTQAYTARLQRLSDEAPSALLAHAYTRWLGDLHGGQLLSQVVRRAYPGHGTAFYDFSAIGPVEQLQTQLREALAAAPLSEQEADAVVQEACWSFNQHALMFEELSVCQTLQA